MKKRVIIAGATGVQRWMEQIGPDKCRWTFDKHLATQFDLDKLDKAAVAYIEKCVGCPITLWPV